MISLSAPRRSGFTLIELLVVISIIAILLTLLFPGANAAFEMVRRTQAKNDATQIAMAINQYLSEYGKLPTSGSDDVSESGNSDALMKILSGQDNVENPREIVFLEVPKAKAGKNGRVNGEGTYKDSWGRDYLISMDANYDNRLNDPVGGGTQITKTVLVWSKGNPARTNDFGNPAKWIKSWE